jgi:hypothetical protein
MAEADIQSKRGSTTSIPIGSTRYSVRVRWTESGALDTAPPAPPAPPPELPPPPAPPEVVDVPPAFVAPPEPPPLPEAVDVPPLFVAPPELEPPFLPPCAEVDPALPGGFEPSPQDTANARKIVKRAERSPRSGDERYRHFMVDEPIFRPSRSSRAPADTKWASSAVSPRPVRSGAFVDIRGREATPSRTNPASIPSGFRPSPGSTMANGCVSTGMSRSRFP